MLRIILTSALIILLLNSCGYYLRESTSLPKQWQPVLVEGNNTLSKIMRRTLIKDGNRVTDKKSNARSIVYIHDHSIKVNSYSIDSALQSVEKQIVAQAIYSWKTFNHAENPPKAIFQINKSIETAESIQIDNPNNITARNAETDFILTELRKTLCQRIMRTISHTAHKH